MSRRLIRRFALAATAFLVATAPARAAPIPFGTKRVKIAAREQPIGAFLRAIFGQLGWPVAISPNLTGAVNGEFDGPAANVYGTIARAFNLASYYDGAIVHVYSTSEVAARAYPGDMGIARHTLAAVRELGLQDAQNRLRLTYTGVLMGMGTPRFLDQVAEIAATHPPDSAFRGGASVRTASTRPAPAQPEGLEFRVFYLRYARAEDTVTTNQGRETRVPGLASILRQLVLDPGDSQTAPQSNTRQIRQTQPRLGGRGLASIAPDPAQQDFNPRNAFYDRFDQFAEQNSVSGDDIARAPQQSVRIMANPTLNAVIVRDAPARMRAYEGLIRALDVEPQIVEVEATIIDVDTTRLKELGLNWQLAVRNFNLGINSLNPLSSRGANIRTIIGNQGQFIAQINALQQRNAARIVARPQVMTLSDVEAVFDRTQTFYVRVQGQQAVDLFNVSTGTVLRVTPHVFRDHNETRVKLQLAIEDGVLTSQTVDAIPVVERSAITTQALLLEGQSLLVGGLTVDTQQRSRERIPVLGDIPVVGNAFRNSRTNLARVERLFLITPRLSGLGQTTAATTAARAAAAPLTIPAPPVDPKGTRP